jgi:hypothetical protein
MSSEFTQLDGYRAADIALRDLINAARKDLENPYEKDRYKRGYFQGLVVASALLAFGEFPQSNADQIGKLLKKP